MISPEVFDQMPLTGVAAECAEVLLSAYPKYGSAPAEVVTRDGEDFAAVESKRSAD